VLVKFTVLVCDEVTDMANNELVSLVVRYVTDSGIVREALVALIDAESSTASNLCCWQTRKLHLLLQLAMTYPSGEQVHSLSMGC